MERRFYRELWKLRFEKMLTLEEEAAACYESLIQDCRRHNADHAILPLLERLVTDEKRHAKLVRELLSILDRQED